MPMPVKLDDEAWRIKAVLILDRLVNMATRDMAPSSIERTSLEHNLAMLWGDLEARNNESFETPDDSLNDAHARGEHIDR